MLRNDLLLLNDAEVIRLPVNQWPMPRAAVRYALENGKTHFATNAAVEAALARVRARLDAVTPSKMHGFAFDGSLTGGEPGLLRDFDTVGARKRRARAAALTYASGERAEISLNAHGCRRPRRRRGIARRRLARHGAAGQLAAERATRSIAGGARRTKAV